jgi:hypothetical protein
MAKHMVFMGASHPRPFQFKNQFDAPSFEAYAVAFPSALCVTHTMSSELSADVRIQCPRIRHSGCVKSSEI